MKSSYEEAALYALLVISVVLIFDLRSVRDTLLAVLPLGLGILQTFGLMGLLDIPLNPANMIALPLMLGIGIDYGVHLIHEFRDQSGPYQDVAGHRRGGNGRRFDDGGRVRGVDDRQPPRAAEPRPRTDARRELLHVHFAGHAARLAQVDLAQSPGGACSGGS